LIDPISEIKLKLQFHLHFAAAQTADVGSDADCAAAAVQRLQPKQVLSLIAKNEVNKNKIRAQSQRKLAAKTLKYFLAVAEKKTKIRNT